MDIELGVICFLTFVIHLIGTLAYSVRIAGVRTRRVAVSFALFNVLVLVSRTSNSFQVPFLAKRVEEHLGRASAHPLLADFRWILVAASGATLLGAFLIPTFQSLFSRAVLHFQVHRSVFRLLLRGLSQGGFREVKESVRFPTPAHLTKVEWPPLVPPGVVLLNVVAVALWTVGVFASLYAGWLKPEVRATASTLSSVINGLATILLFVVIDPQLSVMTDDVIEGRVPESAFRRAIVWLVGSRFAGTLVAQLLFVPAASLIATIAEWL